jgi:hypothetical protein
VNRIDPNGLEENDSLQAARAREEVLRAMARQPKRCISCHNPILANGGTFEDLPEAYQQSILAWLKSDENTPWVTEHLEGLRRQGHVLATRGAVVAPFAAAWDTFKRQVVARGVNNTADLLGLPRQQVAGAVQYVTGGIEVIGGIVMFVPTWGVSSVMIVDGGSSMLGGIDNMAEGAISRKLGVDSLDFVGGAFEAVSTPLTGGPEMGEISRAFLPMGVSVVPRPTHFPRLTFPQAQPAYAFSSGGARFAAPAPLHPNIARLFQPRLVLEPIAPSRLAAPPINGLPAGITILNVMRESDVTIEVENVDGNSRLQLPDELRDRGARLAQEQGREFQSDWLALKEFDPNAPSHVRGWLRNERRLVEAGRIQSPRNPPGYDMGHFRSAPAREGFDYSNSELQLQELNCIVSPALRQVRS